MKLKVTMALTVVLAFLAICAQTQSRLLYWFDTSPAESVTLDGSEASLELDASHLSPGMHTLTVMADGEAGLSSPQTSFFIKIFNPHFEQGISGLVLIDGKPCQSVPAASDGESLSYIIDVADISVGVHTLTTAIVGPKGDMSNIVSSMFMRMPTATEIDNAQAYYIIDRDVANIRSVNLTGSTAAYSLDIDVSDLISGLHSITVYIASPLGFTSTPMSSFFIKIPLGGEGIARYDYWIDDVGEKTTVMLDSRQLPLTVMKMIDVPLAQFRSSNFEIKMEPDGIWAYGKHSFNFMGIDADYRCASASQDYVESRVKKPVDEVTPFPSKQGNLNTGSIAVNDIKWYAINMQVGDSLVLNTGNVSGIDVFNPQGDRCYRVTGRESVVKGGFHAFEDGRYLVAVHDVASKSTSVYYNHIDKFDIIATGPKSTAEADMFALNITGNGILNLKSAKLVSAGKEFEASRIVPADAGHGYCLFDLTGAPLTQYDLVTEFEDETEVTELTVSNAICVEAPNPGEIKTNSNARTVIGTTLTDVVISVTNTGNVPYWGIPFNIAMEADGTKSIIMYLNDFIPTTADDKNWKLYITENLLGTGRRGAFIPMIIPYIGPNERKEFTFTYQLPPAYPVPTYAWTGRPWSDEYKEIITTLEDGRVPEIKNENYISASTINLVMAVVEYNASQTESASTSGISKAPAKAVNVSNITNAADLAINAGEAMGKNMTPASAANTATKLYGGIGNAIGGTILGLALTGDDAVAKNCGYDPNSPDSPLADRRNNLLQALPNPADIARDAGGDIAGAIVDGMLGNNGCASTPSPMPQSNGVMQRVAYDPNDIIGYQDPSGGRYVGVDVSSIPYTIEFENDPELANAPAHVIKVTDRLDPKVFDLSTFHMREIKIGNKSLMLQDSTNFVASIDMRPEINAVAEVSFTLDATTGEAEWVIRSLDLLTMEPATELIQGVLPVNVSGEGCGELQFNIELRKDLASGVKFANSASIIFDSNDAIDTPIWENITDYDRPLARISAVNDDEAGYTFDVEESDLGAGVWSYNLWYRAEGSDEWELLKGAIPAGEVTYETDKKLNGSFCVVATDGAGNMQLETAMTLLLGDADGDGMVDANDVVVIQNYFTDLATHIRKIEADINIDCVIDAQDAVLVSSKFLSEEKVTKIRTRKYLKK